MTLNGAEPSGPWAWAGPSLVWSRVVRAMRSSRAGSVWGQVNRGIPCARCLLPISRLFLCVIGPGMQATLDSSECLVGRAELLQWVQGGAQCGPGRGDRPCSVVGGAGLGRRILGMVGGSKKRSTGASLDRRFLLPKLLSVQPSHKYARRFDHLLY